MSYIGKLSDKGIFMKRKLSFYLLKAVYFAHIHNHLPYGSIIWGSQNYSIKLLRLQKKGIRLGGLHTRVADISRATDTPPENQLVLCYGDIHTNVADTLTADSCP